MSQIIESGEQWQIAGAMTVDMVEALLIESESLQNKDSQQIDLSSVTDVDTATISLMLEWIRRAKARGGKVIFVNLPESLLSLVNLYEVSTLIQHIKR